MGRFIELPFGGEKRNFRLGIGELRDLQDKCNAGPATIHARLISFQPQASDSKRPRADDFERGASDPDFIAQLNLYAMLRSLGGDWRVDDIRETIRLGLIGAGLTPSDAYVLVVRHLDDIPNGLVENIDTAVGILQHALVGEADDPVGKPQAGKNKRKPATA